MTRARDLASFVSNADGDIKFDTDTLFIDSSANAVGIGTTSPSDSLEISGTSAQPAIRLTDADVSGLYHRIFTPTNTGLSISADTGNVANDSFLRFDVDGSERIRIDSSGNVGIGTSSPSVPLHIDMGADNNALYIQSSDQFANIGLIDGSGSGKIIMDSGELSFTTGGNATTSFTGSSERMRIDSSGNVGIGHVPSGNLTSGYVLRLDGGAQTYLAFNNDTHTTQVTGGFVIGNDSSSARITQRENQPIIFDTNNTEVMRLDASGNVGIGDSSPVSNSNYKALTITSTASTGGGQLYVKSSSVTGVLGADNTGDPKTILQTNTNHPIAFGTNNTERMRIDADGTVGIGTTSPSSFSGSRLVVKPFGGEAGTNDVQSWEYTSFSANSEYDLRLQQVVTSGLVKHQFNVRNGGTDYTSNLVLDRGNVGIGTSSPDAPLTVMESSNVAINVLKTNGNSLLKIGEDGNNHVVYNAIYNEHHFQANGTERMRIDDSGNLLVGQTSQATNSTGFSARANSLSHFCRDTSATGSGVLLLNKKTGDGIILVVQKDSSTVGSIGTYSGGIFEIKGESSTVHLSANGGTNSTGNKFYLQGNILPWVNNYFDLGSSSYRWDDVYATNGTIQTSDQNEKQDIEALSDAEKRVATAAKGLIKKFRWKDKVTEKGDDARIHVGIVAQDLKAAFEAEGLDAGRYAMFISTTWTDNDGNEQTRMGVRYSELLAFIIAAI